MNIGIQGVRACFHDVAARKYFSASGIECEPVECHSFGDLCQALLQGRADYCMMAIENSIAGSILTNYSLLERHGLKIVGETYLRIEMCLLALPGQQIASLHTVQSHPMALLQCDRFLDSHPHLRRLEAADTAESAQQIAESKQRGVAAIASRLAGETYGLEILKEGIETNSQNFTRFLVICRPEDQARAVGRLSGPGKASIRFEAPHRAGSLADVLGVFKKHRLNLTKIQSVPILGKPYQYSFHVDFEWESHADSAAALAELENGAVVNLIHFGEYARGDRPQS